MFDLGRSRLPRSRSKTALSAALALTFAASTLLFADDDESAPHQGRPPLHVQETMRAFQNDQLAPENLAAQSITSCTGGFAGSYPCSNVDLMAFLPLNQIGGGYGNDIWGWTDPLTGKEYAIMGRTTGTSFVDISDPVNPVYLGNLARHGSTSSSTWRDIKVYADHAFVVSEANNSGMQVFDLTLLRSVVSPPVTFTETAWYSGFLRAHNIVINEDSGYAYGVGTNNCSGGLHMVSISTPTAPAPAGCFSGDGYTHDAQCVSYQGPDPDHQGAEICFNSNTDTLTIVDVTNKGAPNQLSRNSYTGSSYTHQGWLTEDQVYFLMGDETDETNNGHNTRTYIWDVSNLDAPSLIGTFTASTPAIDHNQYVKGGHTYQSNYRAGLRILDLSDIANGNLSEMGFFDVYPANDTASYNGTWSNFPYFASGLVVISGREQGLFIVKPNFGGASDPPTVSIFNPANNDLVTGDDVTVQIDASDGDDAVGSLDVDWNIDGGPWQQATYNSGTGYYEGSWDTTSSPNGAATVNARATDSDPQAVFHSVTVDVFNTLPAFHIDSISVTVVPANGRRNRGVATVTVVVDEGSLTVGGVTVDGSFTGDWSGSRSAVTDSTSGQAVFETPPVKNGANWTFCVDSAALSGWNFDAAGEPSCGDTSGSTTFGTISGRVTDSSNSSLISGATVSADTGESTSTDAAGDYTLSPVPTGTRTVTVTASGYASKQDSTSVSEGAVSTLDFALDPATSGGTGTIKGTVTDSTGARLGDVLVSTDTLQSALTNRGDKYTIQDVPEGERTVTASKAGLQDEVAPATVNAGSTTTVNFSFAP